MVLSDCEEYRRIRNKKGSGISEEKEEKRALGFVILRGDCVVSLSIEGPPPPEEDDKLTPGGPGVARAAGRGLPVAPMAGAPVGLAGPVRGVGGPSGSLMQPVTQSMGVIVMCVLLLHLIYVCFYVFFSGRTNGCSIYTATSSGRWSSGWSSSRNACSS